MITPLLLVRDTYILVLFFAHIPFVVNHTFNKTPTERLQHYQFWENYQRFKYVSLEKYAKNVKHAFNINWSIPHFPKPWVYTSNHL